MKPDAERAWMVSPDVRSTQSGDGAVLLDIRQGLCFSLNVVGAKVWERLEASETGLTLSQLVSALASQFDVSTNELKTDLEEYLRELERKGLIKPNGNSPFAHSQGRRTL